MLDYFVSEARRLPLLLLIIGWLLVILLQPTPLKMPIVLQYKVCVQPGAYQLPKAAHIFLVQLIIIPYINYLVTVAMALLTPNFTVLDLCELNPHMLQSESCSSQAPVEVATVCIATNHYLVSSPDSTSSKEEKGLVNLGLCWGISTRQWDHSSAQSHGKLNCRNAISLYKLFNFTDQSGSGFALPPIVIQP